MRRRGRRQRATRVARRPRAEVGLEATRGAVPVASRAMGTLCRLLEGEFTALKALPCRPYRPRVGAVYRGVYKLNGAHGERVDRET